MPEIISNQTGCFRWENGDTIPNIDTLKLIAETFEVSVDYLLGHTVGQCQSCGLVLEKDSDKGTECDGSNQRNTALLLSAWKIRSGYYLYGGND